MYKITGVSDEDKALIVEALQSPTREFKQRVSFGYWTATDGVRSFNKSFEVTSVSSASIKQLACSDSSMLTFGCCCAGSAELEFFNPNYGETRSAEAKYSGKIIFIEQGIKYKDGTDSDGNEYYYFFSLGYFKTQSPSSDDKWFTVKVSAYDDIYSMTNKYTSELFSDGAQSVSALSLINELAKRYNLAVDFDENSIAEQYILNQRSLTADEAEILTAYSDAEALGYLAGLAGANARINTVGKLHIGWYSAAESYTMPTKIQWQNGFVKKAEEAFEINSVTLGIDDTVYTSGTGKGLSAVNPLVKENDAVTIKNWFFASVPPTSFLPCEIEWRGDPRIEAGDLISVYDEDGTTYDIFVAEQDLDLTGGLSAKIICPTGDGEMSFDTVSENTRKELNRQKTTLQQAIEKATNAINGAKGGFFEVRDDDGDGNPDGWLIKEDEGGIGGIISANKAGIGLSTDGGNNYRTAITFDGIVADAIICGDLSTISASIGGWSLSSNAIYKDYSNPDGSYYRTYFQAPGLGQGAVKDQWVLSSQYAPSADSESASAEFYITTTGEGGFRTLLRNICGEDSFAAIRHQRNGYEGVFGVGQVGDTGSVALELNANLGENIQKNSMARMDLYAAATNVETLRFMQYRDTVNNQDRYYYNFLSFYQGERLCLAAEDKLNDLSSHLILQCKDVYFQMNGETKSLSSVIKLIAECMKNGTVPVF